MLNKAQDLADTGQDASLLDYLSTSSSQDLERSPTLALLYGIAHGRLGRGAEAQRWVRVALERSRERGDRAIEARALNVSGAIALVEGRIEEAADYFGRALAGAKREGDHGTVGRCSNNLGIISHLRGDFGRAVGSFTMALAAFQQANLHSGIAEALLNMAITYRDQGDLPKALETINAAVEEAESAGDLRLGALTRGGRAEIRLLSGDGELARKEIERALETERALGNVVGEAQALRVLACTHAAAQQHEDAERLLRDVIVRAEEHGRPLLAAQAERDLARVLLELERAQEATELARKARVRFLELGAEAEVQKLDDFLAGAEG